MKEYHKILTVLKRDSANNFKTLTTEFASPEFEYLADCEWEWTEKVDGTNIRVMRKGEVITFGGKTDQAQIPATLITQLQQLFMKSDIWEEQFKLDDVCLYGEGYGKKIQKGGGNYNSDGVNFVLFDVRIGDWWLMREDVEEVAHNLGITNVPIVNLGTLHEAIAYTKEGFKSSWGAFLAEGLVMRPRVEILTRAGGRIITKIKHKDFA